MTIAILDSGVGGLGVLRELREQLPHRPMVYLADQGFGLYGERDLMEVRHRCEQLTRYLLETKADPITLACNSASAAALYHLRALHPEVSFVGMEPAVKPAAEQSRRGVIGVLATTATFQGELFATVVDRHAAGADVVTQSCPGLAEVIEKRGPDDDLVGDLLAEYLAPLTDAGIDTIVLGCTHYGFVSETIAALVGDDVSIIDPAPAVARQVGRIVGREGSADGGELRLLSTGDADRFAAQVEDLLGISVPAEAVAL